MVSVAIPPFLVGALAQPIGSDFDFTASDLGLAIAAYYLVSGVLSPLAGRLVAAIGVTRSLHLACAGSTVGLAWIALAPSAGQITVVLGLLGLPNSVVQPASNQVLSGVRDPLVRGLSFGLVQSAIPASTMLAGLLLAVTTQGSSWRYTVWAVAVLTLVAQVLVAGTRVVVPAARTSPSPAATAPRGVGGPPLMAALVLTGFLASAAATLLPSFVASTGANAHVQPTVVAMAQVVGSLSCVLVRILAAWCASRLSAAQKLTVVGALLALGSCGYLLLARGATWSFVLGTVLAYACGWGWNGLFNLIVTSARPARVAASTGLTQGGVFLGGGAGPLGFAVLAQSGGIGPAWSAVAVVGLAAVACVAYATRRWISDAGHPRTGTPAPLLRTGPDGGPPRRHQCPAE